jgi:hypothetical protein
MEIGSRCRCKNAACAESEGTCFRVPLMNLGGGSFVSADGPDWLAALPAAEPKRYTAAGEDFLWKKLLRRQTDKNRPG